MPDNDQKVLAVRNPVPAFDAEQFELYLTNLEMWSFTSLSADTMKGAMLFQSLPNAHPSGIKQRVSDQMSIEDLKKDTAFAKIIDILKDAFAKEKEAENYAVFKEFLHIKRKDDESMLDFIVRFSGSKIKAAKHKIVLGDTTKAYHLLEASRISETDKRSILAQLVGKDDNAQNETVFKATVSALKTILGESKKVDVDDEDGVKLSDTLYSQELPQDEQEVLALFRKKKYGKNSAQGQSYKKPVLKPRNPIDPNTGTVMRCSSCDAKTHLLKDCYDTYEKIKARMKFETDKGQQLVVENCESESEALFTHTLDKSLVENVVLQVATKELQTLGGHTSGHMLLDSGCSKNVAGQAWIEDYIDGLDDEHKSKVKINEDTEHSFRFGGGTVYKANSEYIIPATVGELDVNIRCNVVEAPIPLLFSKGAMKKAKVNLDFVNDRMEFLGQTVMLQDMGIGHYGVYIRPKGRHAKLIEDCLIASECDVRKSLFPESFEGKVKAMKKLHLQFGHCPKKTLTKLLQLANAWFEDAPAALDKIIGSCKACKLHAPTQPRPIISTGTQATAPGQVVSLDLKERKVGNYKYILYGVDMFSSLVFAVFLKTKTSKEVVDKVFTFFAASGSCIPKKFYSDNGKEFCSEIFKEMCEMMGIEALTTAPYSPWSNGKVEKIHHIVDMIYDKVQSSHPHLSPETILSWACFAKNQWPSSTLGGFSAFQLQYGRSPAMPDNTSAELPNLSGTVTSQLVLDHMKAMEACQKAHSEALFSRKIKDALKNKIRAQQRVFEIGQKVYYKRDQKRSSDRHLYRGPATIIGKRGQVYWLVHQNKVLACGATRLLPVEDGMENYEMTEEKNSKADCVSWIGIEKNGDCSEPVYELDNGDGELVEQTGSNTDFDTNSEADGPNAFDNGNDGDNFHAEVPQDVDQLEMQGPDIRINPLYHLTDPNPENYPKKGDNIQYYDQGVWEDRIVLSRWKKDCDYFNVRPTGCSKEDKRDHGIFLDTASWRYTENEGEEVTGTADDSFDEVLVTTIPVSEHGSPEVIESKEIELKGWREFGAKLDVPFTGQRLLSSRWVVVRKQNPDGTSRVKSRLVVRGCETPIEERQRSDSPCAGRDSFKITVAISASRGWDIKLVDVKNAFLQSHELGPKERIHVLPPKDLRKDGYCWELLRPVYGEQSACRRWWLTLSGFLQEIGGTVSKLDHCLILFYDERQRLVAIVCSWVDDLYICGVKSHQDNIIAKIESYMVIGKVHTNDLKLEKKPDGICVDQLEYVNDMETVTVRSGERTESCNKEEVTLLRHNVGSALWVAGATRPDCSWIACELSTQFKSATLGALRDSNKLIKKLKMSQVRIFYPRFSSVPKLLVWADSSLANLPNKTDTGGGYIIFLADSEGHCSPLAWVANKIRRKVGSTMAAESVILLQAVDHAFFLRSLLSEIVNKESGCFEMVAISDSKNLVENIQSVHQPKDHRLRLEIAQLQEYVSKGLKLIHSPGGSQLADPLTKRTASSALLIECLNSGKLPEQCQAIVSDLKREEGKECVVGIAKD